MPNDGQLPVEGSLSLPGTGEKRLEKGSRKDREEDGQGIGDTGLDQWTVTPTYLIQRSVLTDELNVSECLLAQAIQALLPYDGHRSR